ncbi:MAG: hypothetical protein ACRDTB_11930 [Actinophytocola sp.]
MNRFESRTTLRLLRAEYAVALVVCSALFLWHLQEIDWVVAVFLFAYIDLIGYLPGAVAFRRTPGGDIAKVYYVLYNVMHSFVTHAVVLGVWGALYGLQWAMLAVPIHLCGDRAIFGNFLKSFSVPFEPHPIPAFVDFDRRVVDTGGEPAPVAERI